MPPASIGRKGPLWLADEAGGRLLFSDVPRNTVYSWRADEGVKPYLQPSGYTGRGPYSREPGSNGLTLDSQGRLVSCEHGDRRVSLLTKGGGKVTLADRFDGKRFNSPNDCVFRGDGDLYFTDPPYGLPKNWDDPTRELDWCGVYRVTADGTVTLVTKEFTRPNGLAFSPDEKTLYIAQSDSDAAIWKAFPVNDDGTLGPGKVFADATSQMGKLPGAPDGLKVAETGHLFATGPGGIFVFTPEGRLLGRISTGEANSNCAWGDDGSTLYLTADMYVCRIKTKVRGAGIAAKP